MLSESILSTEMLKISFWVYPSSSAKTLTIRLAFTSNTLTVDLGEVNKWNKVEFLLDPSTLSKSNNYLYWNLKSSQIIYLSGLRVEYATAITPENILNSFSKVSNVLAESYSSIHNSKGVLERMIENAQTYYDNAIKLTYGNFYTAYDSAVQLVDNKNQIDCSSFVSLMIHGIPFEKTRYNENVDNKNSRFFFNNINSYKYRFAHQIALYASDKGYSFKPNADFSNVEPGDVLFFSWINGVGGDTENGVREYSFMKIDHVAVFLHKKNESLWSTLQFDNDISTVYYDANNEYMSQCVLAARFPYANIEGLYPEENLLINGDVVKNVTNTITIGSYKMSKPLKKGRYYTFFIDGNILTENCYFVLQVNGKTIYSDYGKSGSYEGVSAFRFPYLLDDVSDVITISIGADVGVNNNRSALVNWCSLYEGYVRNKKYYNKPTGFPVIKDFALEANLITDLSSNMVPYYKYAVSNNTIQINFSLPFATLRTGNLVIGQMGSDTPKSSQRIPINLIGATNEAINGLLQFGSNGEVRIIPYSSTVQWKSATANGCIFKE